MKTKKTENQELLQKIRIVIKDWLYRQESYEKLVYRIESLFNIENLKSKIH